MALPPEPIGPTPPAPRWGGSVSHQPVTTGVADNESAVAGELEQRDSDDG